MTVFSDAGVDDEVLRRGVVDLGAHHDLLVHQPEVDGVELVVGAGIHLERHALAERAQEPDLRARPVGLLAVVLVRQQVDVVACRRRPPLRTCASARRSCRRCGGFRGRAATAAAPPAPRSSPRRAGCAPRSALRHPVVAARQFRRDAPARPCISARPPRTGPIAHSASPYSAIASGRVGVRLEQLFGFGRGRGRTPPRAAPTAMTPMPRAARTPSAGATFSALR